MQISWAPIHFSPAFSSAAVNDAKYWPNQALPFQLLSGKRGGGRGGSGSEWCCSYSQDGLQEPPSTTSIVCMTKTHPWARKAWGFYLLKIHLYMLLRTTEKLFKIQLFASGTLEFQISLCLMLHNEHWVDLMGHRLRNADTAAKGGISPLHHVQHQWTFLRLWREQTEICVYSTQTPLLLNLRALRRQ